MNSPSSRNDIETRDGEILADLFDDLLQQILEGKTPDLATYLPDRPDLKDRIAKTWALACSVAGRREPSRPVLGGYEILRELGHGGMGTVYLARHQILQRECAIKVLPHSLAMSPRAKQRFLEEAKALARIRHDGVVHIHRILDHAEMLAFEMEYVEGKSLQQLVSDLRELPRPPSATTLASCIGVPEAALGTRNPVEWFVRVVVGVARALGEVHRHGLIHRDVKPSNVLLRADGSPVLADFGLARFRDLGASQTGAFAGTPVYAAPERLRGGDGAVDARTDVYSLGVTLYELLTLQAPFSGTSTHEVLRRIENGALPSLRQQAPHVTRDLEVVVHKAMETDPRHRYASADEFADDLERLMRFEPVHARPAGPARRLLQFARRHQRSVVAGLVGAAVVAIAAWPLAVHAGNIDRRRTEAAELLQIARTNLLSPECLQVAWRRAFAESTLQPRQDPDAVPEHRTALERLLADYDRVLAIDSTLPGAASERAAVAAAVETLAVGVAAPAAATDQDAGTAWLRAFLLGDTVAQRAAGDLESTPGADSAFLSACMALQQTAEGAGGAAFPLLFHATQSFPKATALPLAMADAALEMGNRELAAEWLAKVPLQTTQNATWARQRLLSADLDLAIDGQDPETIYRQLIRFDPMDPVPQHHLAQHLFRHGAPQKAEALLGNVLRKWPNQTRARRDLAWICLQRHDLPGYLRQLLAIANHDRSQLSPAAAQALDDIAAMAGLPLATVTPGTANRAQMLPLAVWLRPGTVRAIARTADLLLQLATAARVANLLDSRPMAASLLTAWYGFYRLPQIGVHAPGWSALAAFAALPALIGAPVELATQVSMPFQTLLGERARVVQLPTLVESHAEPADCEYGSRIASASDIDGDSRPDFVLVCTRGNSAGDSSRPRIEIRSLEDGAPIATLHADRDGVDFGRGFAVLGDADHDLCEDLAIGTPDGGVAGGTVELRSGRTGERLWQIEGATGFGHALASLPDIDGDHVPDLLVGTPSAELDSERGRAVVLSGSSGATLLTLRFREPTAALGCAVADLGDIDADGVCDLGVAGMKRGIPCLAVAFSGRDGRVLHRFGSADVTTNFGHFLLGVGDIDDDRHADFAISAPCFDSRRLHPGRIEILSGATGKLIRVIHGDRTGDCFGTTACVAPFWRERERPAIAISAFRGGPAGTGYVRLFDLRKGYPIQTLAANPAVRLLAPALADIGDVDDDGYEDMLMPLLLRNGRCAVWRFSYALVAER